MNASIKVYLCMGLLVGCGAVQQSAERSLSPIERQYPSAQYVVGEGDSQGTANYLAPLEAATMAARSQIARTLWTRLQSIIVATQSQSDFASSSSVTETILAESSLDPRLGALIKEARQFRQCSAQRCRVTVVLKRSEASLAYQNALAQALPLLRSQLKVGLSPRADLFAFAGTLNAVETARARVVDIQYRLKAIAPNTPLGLTGSDATDWQKLMRLKAQRLSNLSITIAPTDIIELVTQRRLAGATVRDGKLLDPELGRSISESLRTALQGAQLKSSLSRTCTDGLLLTPKGVLTFDQVQGMPRLSLEVVGNISSCAGSGTTKTFQIQNRQKLDVVDPNGDSDYAAFKLKLRRKLAQRALHRFIAEHLSTILPIAAPTEL